MNEHWRKIGDGQGLGHSGGMCGKANMETNSFREVPVEGLGIRNMDKLIVSTICSSHTWYRIDKRRVRFCGGLRNIFLLSTLTDGSGTWTRKKGTVVKSVRCGNELSEWSMGHDKMGSC